MMGIKIGFYGKIYSYPLNTPVTPSYLEHCELGILGVSRDGKKHTVLLQNK